MSKKIAIVTGASRGIGRAIAKMLAENNYIVIANYFRSEEEATDLQNKFDNIDIFKADVSKREDVKKLVEYTLNKYKKIDILVNNAGIDQEKLFQEITDEDWNSVINTNLFSVFCTTQEVVKNMIHNKNGCIINMSSIWGLVGASCESIYSISKAGIDAMTKSLAKELGPSNIRVNSIAPGFIDTDMNKEYSKDDINNIKQDIPLQKIGQPEDIAKCVKWLVEDEYTTGQVIAIDGGWQIH